MKYLKDVVSIKLHPERCIGCGACIEVCPRGVLYLVNKLVTLRDKDCCIECGACSMNCPKDAIFVKKGVGCAQALINSFFNGGKVSCDCQSPKNGSSCC